MSDHCSKDNKSTCDSQEKSHGSCHYQPGRIDWLLWGSVLGIAVLFLQYLWFPSTTEFADWYQRMAASVFELIQTMWWGIVIGIVMVAILAKIPREFVMSILGSRRGFGSILRATAAGFLLDLCSHGILMVGAKLYERGASLGQLMAFLIASPWNSFSLTLILIALIGLPWTLAFIVLSMLIAIISGLIFDSLVRRKVLPDNPNTLALPENFHFFSAAKKGLAATQFTPRFFLDTLVVGVKESRMVLRWILFGVLLASLVRALMTPEQFGNYFGPTLLGLGLTLLVATIVEVCSEGSTPIAADLLTRAGAPGNSFAFLMTGVATDYTEIMVLKDTTKSWKIAFFLPLLTVPQVLFIAWLLNSFAT
jgi:uncharacterized membrane protein YraQ (UPF0718 family)